MAQDIHLRLLADGIVHYPQDELLGPVVARSESAIDKELAEVREVLERLVEVEDTELNDPNVSTVIIRARELCQQLRTDK
jgi:hypothetical protein